MTLKTITDVPQGGHFQLSLIFIIFSPISTRFPYAHIRSFSIISCLFHAMLSKEFVPYQQEQNAEAGEEHTIS